MLLFSFILSISLPVLLSFSLISLQYSALSTSALLIHPPAYTGGQLIEIRVSVCVCVCVEFSRVSCHSGPALSTVCEAICASVGGFVGPANRRHTGRRGCSEEEQRGEKAFRESEKRLGKEGNPIQGEMWETSFGTEKLSHKR